MTRKIADGSANGSRMHAAGVKAIDAHLRLQASAARVLERFLAIARDDEPTLDEDITGPVAKLPRVRVQ